MRYCQSTGVKLNHGYLKTTSSTVEEEEEVLTGSSSRGKMSKRRVEKELDNWVARDLEDCSAEADEFRKMLIQSLKYRQSHCVSPALVKLSKCLDLYKLVCLLCGKSSSSPLPYDPVALTLFGQQEFSEFFAYFSQLPRLKALGDLSFHPALAFKAHDRIKTAIASTLWGENFNSVGEKMFVIRDGPQKGKRICDLFGDSSLVELSLCENESFSVEQPFTLKLDSSNTEFNVSFDEAELWKALYTYEPLYTAIGREGSIALGIAFNIGGSEAIAETFFGVMEAQRKRNQDPLTADMKTVISYCMPDPASCPNTIQSISEVYRKGDLKNKVKQHRSKVFYDKRGRVASKYAVSKAIDNLRKEKNRCPYLD